MTDNSRDAATKEGAPPPVWHAMPAGVAIAQLASHHNGLTGAEAEGRLARHGPNRLPEGARRSALMQFAAQFHDMLVFVLIAAAVVTLAIGRLVDAAVILAVVVINAIIGFVQEGRAEAALRAIRAMLSPQASVLRDGRRVTVEACVLVPGDVVMLEPGDRVPADLRLLHVKGIEVEEGVLTGEALPVPKRVDCVALETVIGDRADMAFFGTLVTRGHASGLVVATGAETEIGRIGSLIESVETLTTPLLRQVGLFGRWLAFAVLAASTVVFVFGVVVHGQPASEMFLAAVGLAVAAIPEELPAILTIALAFGVERMAKRNAIVRRLPAVETLGSVTVICSDKTGTLTRNELTLETVATAESVYRVTGLGYRPRGDILIDGEAVDPSKYPVLLELARGASLCSDARVRRDGEVWRVDGDPMEGAIVTFAGKMGISADEVRTTMPRLDVLPFESESRLMATLHRNGPEGLVYVKGAPERVLALCDRQRETCGDVRIDMSSWHLRLEEMTARGERVLAVATRATSTGKADLVASDLDEGLTMLGLLGLADPPRAEAIGAVALCRSAGIRVKMVTGDHPETARAIAARFGLATDEAITGRDFEHFDREALAERAVTVDVFARMSPEHKLKLVVALQDGGEIVAMTGDGVNDAPALKRADVGVAMGIKGSEAAKEAAQIVLADDNFASIARAVEEGRTVYENIRKSIAFMLPTNGGEAMIVIGAIFLGLPLPITPIQILWINMVTTVTLALALAFEPAEPGIMDRPPRPPGEPILTRYLVWRVVFVSLLMTAATFALFLYADEPDGGSDRARTLAVNLIVALEAGYLLNSRSLTSSALSRRGLLGSRAVLIAIGAVALMQLAFTYLPPFQRLFATVALEPAEWGLVAAMAVGVFLAVEAEKAIVRRFA